MFTGAPNCNFSSSNDYGIPDLLPELQGDFIDQPIRPWGGYSKHWRASRSGGFCGTWHFYQPDQRFAALLKHPEHLLKSGAPSICELNFSMGWSMPPWRALYLVGLKRWHSRYWQDDGRRIFVDLNVAPTLADEETGDILCDWPRLNLLGVPRGWRAYSTRASSHQMEKLESEHALACEHAGTDRIRMIVIGGGRKVQRFCAEHYLEYHPTEMTRWHQQEKQKKTEDG